MAIVAPSGGGVHAAVEKRNGGTIVHGGSLSSESPMTKNLSTSDLADDLGQPYGSKVIAKVGTGSEFTDRVGISGVRPAAVVGGETELGYRADRDEWVMRGGNVTRTLSGFSNTLMIGGAAGVNGADPNRDFINQLESTRLYGKVDIDVLAPPSSGYNSFASKSSGPGGAGGTLSRFIDPAVAGGATNSSDSAAAPTRAVPGELTFMFGGKLPKQENYKARDSAES
jgi:hypothetical protein